MANRLVRRADLVVLRDESAAHSLARAGIPAPFRVGADPAWSLLDDAPIENPQRDGLLVILGPKPHPTIVVEMLVRALEGACRNCTRIDLMPWQVSNRAGDDLTTARAIASRVPARLGILDPPGDLLEARETVSRYRAVASLRLRGLEAAASAGTSALALAHDAEIQGLAHRLGQSAIPFPSDPARVDRSISAALEGEPASRAAVREQAAAAEEGFRLLRLLLGRGRSQDRDEITGLPLAPAPWST
jgi:polysaccharide pyruvyl transferase WcaK-like protein